MQTNTRARRNLLATSTPTASKPTHTPEQLAEIKQLTTQKSEQLKAATALIGASLPHLAVPHIQAAILTTAQLTAIKNFTTPPESLEDLSKEPHKTFLPEELQKFITSDSPSPEEIETIIAQIH